jgi:hypothetical protein
VPGPLLSAAGPAGLACRSAGYALLGLLALAVIGILRFELFCFRDLAQRADADLRYLTRGSWAMVLALVIPLGGICYLYYGRRAN